jgi:hypothetical protein
VNAKTEQDLTWFFDQYLYSRICPRLEWNYAKDVPAGQYEFRYRWDNISAGFPLPVTIKSGEREYVVVPGQKAKTLKLNADDGISVNKGNSYIALKKNRRL